MQGYPQYPGQPACTDAAGYSVPQNAGVMGYPPQGMAPQQGYAPMMAPGMQAPGMAYPPSPMGGGAPMMPPPGGMGMGVPGQQAFNGEDPYAYAQQYGLTRGEVDGALEAYTELSNTDRGLLSAFGAGSAQKVLQKVFGSAGNEQMVAVLIGVLGSALASGRMPTIKDFISMMGQYKMNSMGQSFAGKIMGNGGNHTGGQYPGLGPTGTGFNQMPTDGMNHTTGGGGGLGGMMSSLLGGGHDSHDGKHGKKDKKDKKDKKKKK